MTPRPGSSFILRVIVVNAFLIVGLVQLQRNGRLTGSMIALYAGLFIVANALAYFGARARKRMQDRYTSR